MSEGSHVVICDAEDLLARARTVARRYVREGLERGEDRSRWTIEITDDAGRVVWDLTLAEVLGMDGLAAMQ